MEGSSKSRNIENLNSFDNREGGKNKKPKLLGLIIKSLLQKDILNKKDKKDLLENNELQYLSLCEMQNNWIRDLLHADSLNLEEKKNLKTKVDKEMQDFFLKANSYTGEYKNLSQLKSGVESAYLVAKDLSDREIENEFIGTNNRLDAFYKIDLIKAVFDTENIGEIEKTYLVQVKNKEPNKEEKLEIKNKHLEYISKNSPSLEQVQKLKQKLVQEKIDLENSSEYIETVWSLNFKKDSSIFKDFEDKILLYKKEKQKQKKSTILDYFFEENEIDRKVLETIAVEINNFSNIEDQINLWNLININKEAIKYGEFLDPEFSKKSINFFNKIYSLIQSEDRLREYKLENEEFIENNILSAKEIISQVAYFDEKGELVYEDL